MKSKHTHPFNIALNVRSVIGMDTVKVWFMCPIAGLLSWDDLSVYYHPDPVELWYSLYRSALHLYLPRRHYNELCCLSLVHDGSIHHAFYSYRNHKHLPICITWDSHPRWIALAYYIPASSMYTFSKASCTIYEHLLLVLLFVCYHCVINTWNNMVYRHWICMFASCFIHSFLHKGPPGPLDIGQVNPVEVCQAYLLETLQALLVVLVHLVSRPLDFPDFKPYHLCSLIH